MLDSHPKVDLLLCFHLYFYLLFLSFNSHHDTQTCD